MDFYINTSHFQLEKTLFCGQAFRFTRSREEKNVYLGIAGNRVIKLRQEKDGVSFLNIKDSDLPFWKEYFDTETDYAALTERFSEDDTLKKACGFAYGIRVLKQEPFETLISFIISQNNNIARISGIISRLCEQFGKILPQGGGENLYGFPTAERLAALSAEELAPARAGFRARYIIDAAVKVRDKLIDLDSLYEMNACNAKNELMKIKGVGDKVADCVLLFAYRKTEAVPKDVWIKRVLAEYYPGGFPECVGNDAGIAQQYLFEYIRNNK